MTPEQRKEMEGQAEDKYAYPKKLENVLPLVYSTIGSQAYTKKQCFISGAEAFDKIIQPEIGRLKKIAEDVCRKMLEYKHTPKAGYKLPEIFNAEIEEGLRQFKIENNI